MRSKSNLIYCLCNRSNCYGCSKTFYLLSVKMRLRFAQSLNR